MPTLLTALTDVDNVTTYQPSDVAERLHTYRNVVVALAVAAADSISAKSDPVLAKCTRLKTRSVQDQRGLTDDEILLARVHAATLSRCAPQSQAAAIYAMVDAGMVPGETTSVTTRDVDDYERPSMVYAPGNGHLADRYLPLDRFGSAVIGGRVAKAVADGYSPSRPLTYVPRKNHPGSKQATASAQGVLTGSSPSSGWPASTPQRRASPSGGSPACSPRRVRTPRCRSPVARPSTRCTRS
jgi:hypothetical protein